MAPCGDQLCRQDNLKPGADADVAGVNKMKARP